MPSGNRTGTRRGCESIGSCGIKAMRKQRCDFERRRSRAEPDTETGAQARVEVKDPPDGRDRSRWARASGRSTEGSSRREKPKAPGAAQAKAGTDGSLGKIATSKALWLRLRARSWSGPPKAGNDAASSEACRSAGPGDRREARMPLPARAEHAAETRSCILRDQWLKSGDTGTGSNAGPLLRFRALRGHALCSRAASDDPGTMSR